MNCKVQVEHDILWLETRERKKEEIVGIFLLAMFERERLVYSLGVRNKKKI